MQSDESGKRNALRQKIIGLGERSFRKSYYPALQERMVQLERFRALLDHTRDAIVVVELPSGTIVDVNDSACTQLGYSRDELLGRAFEGLWTTEVEKLLQGFADREPKFPNPATIETHLSTRDGRPVPVEVTLRRADFHEGDYVVAVARDITERKKADLALRESEERYRLLAENSLTGIYIQQDGRFIYVNRRLAAMLGYHSEELMDKEFRDFVCPDDLPMVDLGDRVPGGGDRAPIHCEFRIVCRDRSEKWVDLLATTIFYRGRAAEMGNVADISDRKSLEEQLQQAAKMEAIGKLAGGVAHDFNNLLTAMLGYSALLLQQLEGEDEKRNKLIQVIRAGERASELTRQLLAFSRKQVLSVKVIDLNSVVCHLEKMLRRIIGEHVELTTHLDPYLHQIEADPVQVEQIVMNLVVNARDAMPDGGTITIETSNAFFDGEYPQSRSEIPPGRQVLITVSDTGMGMDGLTASRIFDPFFTTKEKGLGTGLGLSTVYGIIKQHRGHISVNSGIGRGTTFQIYFPAVDVAVDSTREVPHVQGRPLGSETILVVEDEDLVRELVCEVLLQFGYSTLSANGPDEAIGISEGFDGVIHAMITDVVMPGMDGRRLYEYIAPKRPDMKVLYVSGHTEDSIVQRGVLDGNVHFLHKPFTAERLAVKVREILDAADSE